MLHRENYILNRFNTLCPSDNPHRVSKNFQILNGHKRRNLRENCRGEILLSRTGSRAQGGSKAEMCSAY